jgi:N-acetylglucosamine malate deacetylase 1
MRVLCVAAHPDDEALGCGATLAKHSAVGDEVRILIMGTGATARGFAGQIEVDRLKVQAELASQSMGASVALQGLPDNRLDSLDLLDLAKIVEDALEAFPADVVYTHHAGDLNIDHRLVHQAVVTACRPTGKPVKSILTFEVQSSTEWGHEVFSPTVFVNVAGVPMVKKLEALKCYAEEMRAFPHPRSVEAIKALAAWRGATAGVREAEAFMVVREVR